jgi:REP element-mobilizing transposase RayT
MNNRTPRAGSVSDGSDSSSILPAYFITFTTYGAWLHGRAPGSVDREHNVPGTPFLPAEYTLEAEMRARMRQEPYLLDEPRRAVALQTVQEVARHRRWKLHAAHVRSNHVHLLVTAADSPEKVMKDFKAWMSRRLRESFDESADRDRWTQHGSTRWLNTMTELEAAWHYIVHGQGDPMAVYDSQVEMPFEVPSLTLPARKESQC